METLPEGAILVSLDVVGLYPHIPHAEGLEAIRHALNELYYYAPLELSTVLPQTKHGTHIVQLLNEEHSCCISKGLHQMYDREN